MFIRPSYFFHCLQFDKPVDTCVGLFTTTTTTKEINEKGAKGIILPSPPPPQKKRKRRKKGQGPLYELWSGLCITEVDFTKFLYH